MIRGTFSTPQRPHDLEVIHVVKGNEVGDANWGVGNGTFLIYAPRGDFLPEVRESSSYTRAEQSTPPAGSEGREGGRQARVDPASAVCATESVWRISSLQTETRNSLNNGELRLPTRRRHKRRLSV